MARCSSIPSTAALHSLPPVGAGELVVLTLLLYAMPLLALLLLPSCSRWPAAADQPLVQGEQPLSTLHVADPNAAAQLLKGWHEVEHGGWRWTEKQFSVALKAPAAGQPAALKLEFALPETLISRLHSVTLTATANGVALPGETYARPADQVYTRTVPASATRADLVRIDFLLDKALAPGEVDQRELGVVVSSVGLR